MCIRDRGYAQRLDLNILEQIDFSLTDVVRPGAIVGIDGHRDVVGISGEPFEVDGVTYETISTEAPLYAAIEGLRLGDTYEFRGQEPVSYTHLDVYKRQTSTHAPRPPARPPRPRGR